MSPNEMVLPTRGRFLEFGGDLKKIFPFDPEWTNLNHGMALEQHFKLLQTPNAHSSQARSARTQKKSATNSAPTKLSPKLGLVPFTSTTLVRRWMSRAKRWRI
jgi:hypothetical protein